MSTIALRNAQSPLVLALDIGSSSVRALVFDGAGVQVEGSETQLPYEATITPDGGVEVDPGELLQLCFRCIDGGLAFCGNHASTIGAVGCSSFWHGLIALDASRRPVTPVLMWSDKRSGADARRLEDTLGRSDVHAETGCRLHSSFWPAKISWLARTQPQTFATVKHWVSFADYFGYHLTGEIQTSISMASGTGLLDANTLDWHDGMLKVVAIDRHSLPRLVDRDVPQARLTKAFAARWPALVAPPWFPTLGDGACANVGAGCVGASRIAVTIGTSAALRIILPDHPNTEGRHDPPLSDRIWCYRLDRTHRVIGGALSNGGNVTSWLAELTAQGEFQPLVAGAEFIPPDGHGLTFLPFLAGERSPSWNDSATGTISGLSLTTSASDIYRAAIEAAAYRLAAIYDVVAPFAATPHEIHVNGAAALASPLWLQIIADTLNHQLDAVDAEAEASARGAALCALYAIGAIGTLSNMDNTITRTFWPNQTAHVAYSQGRNRQSELEHVLYAPTLPHPQEYRGRRPMTLSRTSGLSILWIYAHPDDEAMGNAGTMCHARANGMTTGLICATRGENGEISDPALATPGTLGAVRERELRRAMDRTGLDELRLLEYRDSGMDGTPQNQDPRTLYMADEPALVASLVMHIRELRPQVVVTFGPDGVYGHPDHIRIGAATDTAILEAAANGHPALGDPWQVTALYHAAAPREALIELRNNPDGPFRTVPMRIVEKFGVPTSEITHWIDTGGYADAKLEVIRCHATQFVEHHPMFDAESVIARTWLSREQFRQVAVYVEEGSDPIDELAKRYPASPYQAALS